MWRFVVQLRVGRLRRKRVNRGRKRTGGGTGGEKGALEGRRIAEVSIVS